MKILKALAKKCEKMEWLGLNPFNRCEKLGAVKGLLGFPLNRKDFVPF